MVKVCILHQINLDVLAHVISKLRKLNILDVHGKIRIHACVRQHSHHIHQVSCSAEQIVELIHM